MANIILWAEKSEFACLHIASAQFAPTALLLFVLGKDLTMWDDDPDILDAFEEYDYECESDDGLDDLAFDSVIAADVEDGAFDNDGDFFDDED